ncbi:hypothetical protein HPB48_008586 [Haemaphysalis longicornis]|uniref:Innexin n=1 Tax=Haemaphysalis longicornis TaxID=44386 RepID=A0A9J6GG05_HAELO|nr:hypothetical protein HPB48_008586 [Haemaphysalis longicornis]
MNTGFKLTLSGLKFSSLETTDPEPCLTSWATCASTSTRDGFHIDGNVFRLYTSATVASCSASCTLLTAREYVGTPPSTAMPDDLPAGCRQLVFCWVESTFSHRSLFNASYDDSVIYSGTGHRPKGSGSDDRKYHTYYQWVCFLLFAQAVCSLRPRWLWKDLEGRHQVRASSAALDIRAADGDAGSGTRFGPRWPTFWWSA